jgi:hypothetical protein
MATKTLYDLELLRKIGNYNIGDRVRGECASTSDFSKFKRWFLELNDIENLNIADNYGKVRTLFKMTFKLVEIVKEV